MDKIASICSTFCFGREGYHGSCCSVEERDFIIGPMPDSHDFLKRLVSHIGRSITWDQVFITYDEGKNLFPDKESWQDPANYPALRIDLNSKIKPCLFYNESMRFCSIHKIRPDACAEYFCDYLAKEMEGREETNVDWSSKFSV